MILLPIRRLLSYDCGRLFIKARKVTILLLTLFFVFSILRIITQHYRTTTSTTLNSTEPLWNLIEYQYGNIHFDDHDGTKNETGFDVSIVPDIVHYIQLKNPYLEFVTLISIMSTLRHHRPRLLLIHSDRKVLRGKYWDQVKQLNKTQTYTIIRLNHIKQPKYIFGKKLSSVYHASDIVRLRVLQQFGGIYLDNDVYVVRSLHRFRVFEFAIGWPEDQFLGTQVLICHRNARFLKLWYESYREYKPTLWYYNAGELPTTKFLEKQPNLVHREKIQFGVHYLVDMLYEEQNPFWDKMYYAIHMLARHRSHSDGIVYFNEDNIKDYNRTFGQMARLAYYGNKNILK